MTSAMFKGIILCSTLATALVSGCGSDDDDADTNNLLDGMIAGEDAVSGGTDGGGTDGEDTVGESAVDGLVSIESVRPTSEAIGALQTALENIEAITALPLIDHQLNAMGIGETLRPTSVQLFGNPALGTPLMQVNQLAGLDLPQKILAWENEDGNTQLAYNSVDYLQQRHGITGSEDADIALQTISGALANLSFNASGNIEDGSTDSDASPTVAVSVGQGIIMVTSTLDMDTTYSTLVTSIQNAEPLNLFAEVDHAANAAGIEQPLNPTRLVIFGNPSLGTPLMQAEQTIGIDLPQKMLVFENAEGVVTIAYNDPEYLAERHGITGQEDRLATISGALAGLASAAAAAAPEQ